MSISFSCPKCKRWLSWPDRVVRLVCRCGKVWIQAASLPQEEEQSVTLLQTNTSPTVAS